MRPLTVADGDHTVTIHAGGPGGDDTSRCTLTCSRNGTDGDCALPHLSPMPVEVAWFRADEHLNSPRRPILNGP